MGGSEHGKGEDRVVIGDVGQSRRQNKLPDQSGSHAGVTIAGHSRGVDTDSWLRQLTLECGEDRVNGLFGERMVMQCLASLP